MRTPILVEENDGAEPVSTNHWARIENTHSAETRLMPRPPARVLKMNSRHASGESPPLLNSFICSRRDSCDVEPSIRQTFHFLYSIAQSSCIRQ